MGVYFYLVTCKGQGFKKLFQNSNQNIHAYMLINLLMYVCMLMNLYTNEQTNTIATQVQWIEQSAVDTPSKKLTSWSRVQMLVTE